MSKQPFTGNPSEIIVEQLSALGVNYLFYNSGSREARFFDALHENPRINGILGLHEGTVTAMAGGYTQAKSEPAVMSVHLGAGLAQSMGQLINVWAGSLPVVTLTFVGDTGSYADRITLDLGHNVGPTSIAAPFMKANWTVLEAGGLTTAIERAIKVASTPPIGPVHVAIYDRLLGTEKTSTSIIEHEIPKVTAGYPDPSDIEKLAKSLNEAERPLIYVGDGAWKSGAESTIGAIAEHFGANIASMWGDLRGVSVAHPLHCGYFRGSVLDLNPDLIVCVGVRHGGSGTPDDYSLFKNAKNLIAIGPDVEIFENIPDLGLTIMADETATFELLQDLIRSENEPVTYNKKRDRAWEIAHKIKENGRKNLQHENATKGSIRPMAILDAIDTTLEKAGGGYITTEQFAIPLEYVNKKENGGKVKYVRPAGGSEGYGMGAPIGTKLGAPDQPVIGLVGDGSVYYSDSALWTAANHKIPVLYVIANNGTYGIVAGQFAAAEGAMKREGKYAGVVLDGIEIVKLAESFGVEGIRIEEETKIQQSIEESLDIVEREGRPLLLDVKMPLGLPQSGQASKPFHLGKSK